ncbi:MAG: hypothetical protein AAFW47_04635 [Pseudomonadota bacterium]
MSETFIHTQQSIDAADAAGRAAAAYCHPDPVHWIEQAGVAGIELALCKDTGLVTCFLSADFLTATFLEAWLDASDHARSTVEAILLERGVAQF